MGTHISVFYRSQDGSTGLLDSSRGFWDAIDYTDELAAQFPPDVSPLGFYVRPRGMYIGRINHYVSTNEELEWFSARNGIVSVRTALEVFSQSSFKMVIDQLGRKLIPEHEHYIICSVFHNLLLLLKNLEKCEQRGYEFQFGISY